MNIPKALIEDRFGDLDRVVDHRGFLRYWRSTTQLPVFRVHILP